MPMPTLDPSRHFAAVLADPSHKLPMPDRGGRMFSKDGEVVDSTDPFYAHLLADGSLKPKPKQAAAPDQDPSIGDGAPKADEPEVAKNEKLPTPSDASRRLPAPPGADKAQKADPAA